MWTATWDKDIEAIARASFRNYVRLHVGSEQLSANENIRQDIMLIKNHERYDHLAV
jgi:superfamily II DNA/RNA helicase